jgi:TPR repeat protein
MSPYFDDIRKAAEQGDDVAQWYLGHAYDFGKGVARNPVKAVRWWRKAATQGDADGQYSLGTA